MFELVLFTASEQFYADQVINLFDPDNRFFAYRLYRPHCLQVQPNVFVKDLSRLGRDLTKTILVDNSIHAFAY